MQVSARCRRVELFYTDQRLSNKIILYAPQSFPSRTNYICFAIITLLDETSWKTLLKRYTYSKVIL